MVILYVAMDIPRWLRGLYDEGKKEGRWTSVEDWAKEYGFKTATLDRWMTGARNPEPLSCLRLAHAFDAPVNDVLEWAGHGAMSALFNVTVKGKTATGHN